MKEARPKKSLGQHWLHDPAVLADICDDAQVRTGDVVLEIGPGLGTLTRQLLDRGAYVTAVEYDAALAHTLRNKLLEVHLEVEPIDSAVLEKLTVVEGNILQFNLQQLPKSYKVVANIPYYLTSNLIRVLCESQNPFDRAALLIQKEVAERICAKPGQMSLLSVSAQYYCDVSLGTYVPREFFEPAPKVDSQVVVLQYRPEPLFIQHDTAEFFRVVRAGFSQKRKTLLNSLSAGLHLPKSTVQAALKRSGIAENLRAQALTLDEWDSLTEALKDN